MKEPDFICIIPSSIFFFFAPVRQKSSFQRAGPLHRLLPWTSYRPSRTHPTGTEAADPGERRGPGAAERERGRGRKSGLSQTPGFVREGGGAQNLWWGSREEGEPSLSAQ